MLTEPTKPNESGQTMCVVRWQVNLSDGLWLGAWDKEAFEAYTAPLLARIAELETLIAEILVDVAAYEKRSGAKVSGWPDKARAAMKEHS